MIEARMRLMLLQAKRRQGLLATTRSRDKTERSSPESPGECSPNDTLISDFRCPEMGDNKLLLSKPPS